MHTTPPPTDFDQPPAGRNDPRRRGNDRRMTAANHNQGPAFPAPGRVAELEARVAELEAEVVRYRTEAMRYRHAATHDPLTGLLNRAGLAEEWPHRGSREHLALIDLNGFKSINDQHGHAAGDTILSAVACWLRSSPQVHVAARLGGDEFAVLVGVDSWLPARVAATLPGGTQVAVGLSTGLAPAVGDLSVALARADAAMYRAKATRTGVELYDPRRDDRPVIPRPRVRLREQPREDAAARDVLWSVA